MPESVLTDSDHTDAGMPMDWLVLTRSARTEHCLSMLLPGRRHDSRSLARTISSLVSVPFLAQLAFERDTAGL